MRKHTHTYIHIHIHIPKKNTHTHTPSNRGHHKQNKINTHSINQKIRTKYKIQNTKYKIQNTKHTPSAEASARIARLSIS